MDTALFTPPLIGWELGSGIRMIAMMRAATSKLVTSR